MKRVTILLKEGQRLNDYNFVIRGSIRSFYIINDEEKTKAFFTDSLSFPPISSVNGKRFDHYVACVEGPIITVVNAGFENTIF